MRKKFLKKNFNPKDSRRSWLPTVNAIFHTQLTPMAGSKKIRIVWVKLDDDNKEIFLKWYRSTDHHSFEAMTQALLGESKGEATFVGQRRCGFEAVGVSDGVGR